MVQWLLAVLLLVPGLALAQACPDKHLNYWQAFPAPAAACCGRR
jgi:hypothetical protein